MTQQSVPVVDSNLSDIDWRDLGLGEAGVVADFNGSSYGLVLPTDSDVAQVGSSSQRSVAHVANFVHRIPAGEPEPLTIPAASGAARTDVVALRYDPVAHTGDEGPVRLVRIPGSAGGGAPGYDDSPPGVEELPLWSITRTPGQSLSQATVTRMFSRLAPSLEVSPSSPLPSSSPLGTLVRRGPEQYQRAQDSNGNPVWRNPNELTSPRRWDWGKTGYLKTFNEGVWRLAPGSLGRFNSKAGHLYEITSRFSIGWSELVRLNWRFSQQVSRGTLSDDAYGTVLEETDGCTGGGAYLSQTVVSHLYAEQSETWNVGSFFAVSGNVAVHNPFGSPSTFIKDLGISPAIQYASGF